MGKASRTKKDKPEHNSPKPKGNSKNILVVSIMVALVFLGISVGFGLRYYNANNTPSKTIDESVSTNLSDVIPANAPKEVKEAYQFTQENIDLTKKITCYCGCLNSAGHENLSKCYVREIKDNGQIVYDSHASMCQICIGEALDSKKWLSEGLSPDQIVKLIDARYNRPAQGQ